MEITFERVRKGWPWLVVGALVLLLVILPPMDRATRFVIGVQWPVTVVVLVLLFRSQVASLLDRIVKAGKDGVEFAQHQHLPRNTDPAAPGPVNAPVGPSNVSIAGSSAPAEGSRTSTVIDHISPVYRAMVMQQLSRQKERLQAMAGKFEISELELALTWVAEVSSALHLERASKTVYQSQLNALEQLQYMTTTKEAFRPYYQEGSRANPRAYESYTFDNWFAYLVAMDLVSGPDDAVRVTPAGEALQMYIKQQGYTALPA